MTVFSVLGKQSPVAIAMPAEASDPIAAAADVNGGQAADLVPEGARVASSAALGSLEQHEVV